MDFPFGVGAGGPAMAGEPTFGARRERASLGNDRPTGLAQRVRNCRTVDESSSEAPAVRTPNVAVQMTHGFSPDSAAQMRRAGMLASQCKEASDLSDPRQPVRRHLGGGDRAATARAPASASQPFSRQPTAMSSSARKRKRLRMNSIQSSFCSVSITWQRGVAVTLHLSFKACQMTPRTRDT